MVGTAGAGVVTGAQGTGAQGTGALTESVKQGAGAHGTGFSGVP